MIKVSQIDLHALVEFVRSYEVDPDWMSMQLPNGTSAAPPYAVPGARPVSPLERALDLGDAGRNMNQCMRAAQAMGMTYLQPPVIHPIKRKSIGDPNNEPLPKKLAMTPMEPQAMPYQRLQPRPSPNGFSPVNVPSPTVPPPSQPRKRGRPSKADKEAQARNHPTGPYPPILAPMPLAPREPVHPPAQEPALNAPFAYPMSSGPLDPKTKKRGGKATAADRPQPLRPGLPGLGEGVLMEASQRGVPENLLEQMERTPALGNVISAPSEASLPRGGPAIPDTTRRLVATYPPSPAPAANMDRIRNENHAPLPPVNTTA